MGLGDGPAIVRRTKLLVSDDWARLLELWKAEYGGQKVQALQILRIAQAHKLLESFFSTARQQATKAGRLAVVFSEAIAQNRDDIGCIFTGRKNTFYYLKGLPDSWAPKQAPVMKVVLTLAPSAPATRPPAATCQCGCGDPLPPSKNRRPRRFIQGHNRLGQTGYKQHRMSKSRVDEKSP